MRTGLRLTWARVIYLLGIALGALQLCHMYILNRLDKHSTGTAEILPVRLLENTINKIYPIVQGINSDSSVIDSSGNYRIVYNIYETTQDHNEADILHKKFGVTLASHCSLNHVHHLLRLSQQWQGPVSLAIFIPDSQRKHAMEALILLGHCIPHIAHNISIHLVFPLTPASFDSLSPSKPVISSQLSNCQHLQTSLETLLQKEHQNYDLDNEKYPNNLLRNTARRWVSSHFVLIVDIDMVPSDHLYQNFIDFTRRLSFTSDHPESYESLNTVYILPSFEIQQNSPVPKDKRQLLLLWKQGNLRPFYHELCYKCQEQTNYKLWRNLTSTKGISAAYSVPWKDPWEPFYIGPTATLPLYDERFKQYGFNRISQVCETHIAGYQFEVLDNAFLVHLGLKTAEGFHHSKDREQEQNRLLFRQFKEELKTKYPESERRCY